MATSAQQQAFFAHKDADALLAFLVKSYNDVSKKTLGRTILQKLCYFAKASGVPIPFQFEIYHYGPFSQEIFYRTEDLLLDGVIRDQSSDPGQSAFVPGPNLDSFLSNFPEPIRQYRNNLQQVTTLFSLLDPSQMELVSTIHYMHSSHRQWFKQTPDKDAVVTSVFEVKKDRFTKQAIERSYDILLEARLLP